MSSVAKVVNRGDIFEKIGIQNKWKWEWLPGVVKVGETDEHIGQHVCVLGISGIDIDIIDIVLIQVLMYPGILLLHCEKRP